MQVRRDHAPPGANRRAWGVLASLALAPPAHAQTTAPPGVAVEQGYGFATVSWGAVAGATEYEIERTPLAGSTPSGPALTVGRWLPTRYSAQGRQGGERTFADSGFALGERYRWRVRAVIGAMPGEWSSPRRRHDPSADRPAEPPDAVRAAAAERASRPHEEEVAYLKAIDAASKRVRVDQVGTTHLGRPIYLATVGAPGAQEPEGHRQGRPPS